MAETNPWLLLVMLALTAAVARIWMADLRAARAGKPVTMPLPGATSASLQSIILAVVGSAVLLGFETVGEMQLGIVDQQSRITVLFGLFTLAAAFGEELIFRGYCVVAHRGRTALIASCVIASATFALLHPFLWQWHDGALVVTATPKAWFSTFATFAASLWFYTVRFWRLNPSHSLLPCIAAHAAKNIGVFGIKLAQGYVVGFW